VEDLGELDVSACYRRRGEVQDHLRLHQFSARRRRCACRLSHHFVSFCGGHLFLCVACSTGIFGAILRCLKHHCMRMYKRGEQYFSSWFMVGVCFHCEGFVWAREVSPHFLQGVDVYVLCVCVYAHAHTLRREASRSRTASPSTARQRMILCSRCLLIETVFIIIRVSSVTSH